MYGVCKTSIYIILPPPFPPVPALIIVSLHLPLSIDAIYFFFFRFSVFVYFILFLVATQMYQINDANGDWKSTVQLYHEININTDPRPHFVRHTPNRIYATFVHCDALNKLRIKIFAIRIALLGARSVLYIHYTSRPHMHSTLVVVCVSVYFISIVDSCPDCDG